eukprot:1505274-Pleurochrysis_carterae.AAC.1
MLPALHKCQIYANSRRHSRRPSRPSDRFLEEASAKLCEFAASQVKEKARPSPCESSCTLNDASEAPSEARPYKPHGCDRR